ncbi:hypothetical protein OPT61_g4821 [Boeremia exigua]|uniref:Uncharacterized protein n=1 Tax=Boeremia exigua TaxID=749465 RepID=A0ACC2ICJ6_9PLEO|nr:hypothetical protein OPT61_g4821 [Boeremia exigua]
MTDLPSLGHPSFCYFTLSVPTTHHSDETPQPSPFHEYCPNSWASSTNPLLAHRPLPMASPSAALRQTTPNPACRLSAAAFPLQARFVAAAAAANRTVTPACFSLAPTSTTAVTVPRWLATALVEAPPTCLAFSLNIVTAMPSYDHISPLPTLQDFGLDIANNVQQYT